MSMKCALVAAVALATLPLSVSAAEVDLDALRELVSKYQDIEVALAGLNGVGKRPFDMAEQRRFQQMNGD